jgi:hypothetical protein
VVRSVRLARARLCRVAADGRESDKAGMPYLGNISFASFRTEISRLGPRAFPFQPPGRNRLVETEITEIQGQI